MKFFSSALVAFVASASTALLGSSHIASAQTWEPGNQLFVSQDYGFGWQVDIDNDRAIVGSYQSNESGTFGSSHGSLLLRIPNFFHYSQLLFIIYISLQVKQIAREMPNYSSSLAQG